MAPETIRTNAGKGTISRHIVDAIAAALDGIRYGAVEIVVHEGRIVQIERKEKVRFGAAPPTNPFER